MLRLKPTTYSSAEIDMHLELRDGSAVSRSCIHGGPGNTFRTTTAHGTDVANSAAPPPWPSPVKTGEGIRKRGGDQKKQRGAGSAHHDLFGFVHEVALDEFDAELP